MSDPDSEPRLSNNTERANRILDAASKLIIHYGYTKTTVSDIAQEAGVSKGTIYLHWRSKEALFEALIVREIKRYLDDFLTHMEADPEGGTLAGMYKHSLTALDHNPFIQALYSQDRRVLGEFAQRDDYRLLKQRLIMRQEFVQEMQAFGLVRPELDPAVVAYIFLIISYGFISIDEAIPPDQAPPMHQVIEVLSDLLNRGLTPKSGGDSEAGKRILGRMFDTYRKQVAEAGRI